jgi:hypothetical protein
MAEVKSIPQEKKETSPEPGKKIRKKKRMRIVFIILGILLLIRICLPYIILHYLNKKLASLDGYYGHIADIDLALYRGAYVINDIYIKKVDKETKDTTDFFTCPVIDLSVQWHAIFEKKIVGEVEFEQPILRYTLNKNIGKKAEKDSTNFIQLVKDFMPIRINRFATNKAQIHYVDLSKSPVVDLPMTNVNIEAINLTNQPDTTKLLPATISLRGNLYDGNVSVNVHLDPLNKAPTFDLDAALTKTNLVHLNPFFTAYADFDLKSGNMSMYSEFAARDNKFTGYVKPIIKDLDIVQFNKEEGNGAQIMWEAFIGSTAEILQNQKRDQFASKIPVEGNFTSPDIGVIEAIFSVLRNAFIQGLNPSIDNSINITSVKVLKKESFLDKIFNKKKK